MDPNYSLLELASSVQAWCREQDVRPANGQAAEVISERTIRYYRSLGLLDAPGGEYGKSFTERHRLQLLAVRIYQEQGLPLAKIHGALYGQTEAALLAIVANRAGRREPPPADPFFATSASPQQWTVAPLDDDLMLISRRGRPLRPELIAKLRQLLEPGSGQTTSEVPVSEKTQQ